MTSEIDSGDLLTVSLDGVNLNAITHVDRVFQVTNNGSEAVSLYFGERPGNENPDGNSVDIGTRTDQLDGISSVDGDGQSSSDGIADENRMDLFRLGAPSDGTVGYDEINVRLDTGETWRSGSTSTPRARTSTTAWATAATPISGPTTPAR